ncbi:hypothetical protein MRX96_041980 [Rhipicephalus microplus]
MVRTVPDGTTSGRRCSRRVLTNRTAIRTMTVDCELCASSSNERCREEAQQQQSASANERARSPNPTHLPRRRDLSSASIDFVAE